MAESPYDLVCTFEGQEPQRFPTIQAAMFWVEGLDDPTGSIAFMGQNVITYDHGQIYAV